LPTEAELPRRHMFATTARPREHPAAKSPTVKAGRAGHALDPPNWRQLWSVGMAAPTVPYCVIWAHPKRVQLRAMRAPDDYRGMWDMIERLCRTPSPAPDGCAKALCACGSMPSGPSPTSCVIWSSPLTPRLAARSSTSRVLPPARPPGHPPIRPQTPRHLASTWTRARRWQRCWRCESPAVMAGPIHSGSRLG
jgi:hypothetical protein